MRPNSRAIIAYRFGSICLALLLSGVVAHQSAGEALGRTDNKSKPIVFIHGYAGGGFFAGGCNGDFGHLAHYLRDSGFTGNFHWLQFINGDSACDQSGLEPFWNSGIWQYGTHGDIHGHSGTVHDNNTDYRHLAWHFAWFMHDWYAGEPAIDVIAHSGGAHIVRFALAKEGQPCDCSRGSWPRLQIEDVVTVGGTNYGADTFLGYSFVANCSSTQCQQLRPESWFISTWLRDNAMNPQGEGGTDWTVIGSEADEAVTESSATAMSAHNRFRYGQGGPDHDGYMRTNVSTGGTDWYAGAYHWTTLPGPQMLTRKALIYGHW